MQSLVYVSEENARLEPEELMPLLRTSRTRNRERDISGLLAYRDGHYLQILEGPDDEIETLYKSIAQDSRHRDVRLISQAPIEVRDFGKWPMAFRFLSDVQIERLPAFEEALKEGFGGPSLSENPAAARALLLALRDLI